MNTQRLIDALPFLFPAATVAVEETGGGCTSLVVNHPTFIATICETGATTFNADGEGPWSLTIDDGDPIDDLTDLEVVALLQEAWTAGDE